MHLQGERKTISSVNKSLARSHKKILKNSSCQAYKFYNITPSHSLWSATINSFKVEKEGKAVSKILLSSEVRENKFRSNLKAKKTILIMG